MKIPSQRRHWKSRRRRVSPNRRPRPTASQKASPLPAVLLAFTAAAMARENGGAAGWAGLIADGGSGCISRSNFLAMFAAQLLRDRDAAAEDFGTARADFALAPADLRWLTRRMATE
uniref:SERPIN domain-containing protein n=1 Tax=Macrostomum lignano TaxID=282301 RepID=A0A1I8F9U3_9PLAT